MWSCSWWSGEGEILTYWDKQLCINSFLPWGEYLCKTHVMQTSFYQHVAICDNFDISLCKTLRLGDLESWCFLASPWIAHIFWPWFQSLLLWLDALDADRLQFANKSLWFSVFLRASWSLLDAEIEIPIYF